MPSGPIDSSVHLQALDGCLYPAGGSAPTPRVGVLREQMRLPVDGLPNSARGDRHGLVHLRQPRLLAEPARLQGTEEQISDLLPVREVPRVSATVRSLIATTKSKNICLRHISYHVGRTYFVIMLRLSHNHGKAAQ